MNDERPVSGLTQLKIDRSAKATVTTKPWLKPLALLVLAGLAAAAYLLAPRTLAVDTTAVVMTTPSQQFVNLTASGYVVAQRRAAVASKATGRLVALHVREGSQVKAGDLLAKLDDSDIQAAILGAQAQVHQAQANVQLAQVQLIQARADLTRTQGLVAQGFVSPQMADSAQSKARVAAASAAAATASLQQARAQLQAQKVGSDYTEIRAPFDGVVLVKNANVGDIITPMSSAVGAQSAVVTMADMGTLEVEADVSEGNLSQVRVGQPVEVLLDALPGARFKGRVSGIVPTVDRAKATVMTKVRFDALDPRILPEMSAKVSFLSQEVSDPDQRAVLAVPPAAVLRRDAQAWVFAVTPQVGGKWVLQERAIKVGRTLGDVVEVTGDLKAGDKLVARPGPELKAGQAVSPNTP